MVPVAFDRMNVKPTSGEFCSIFLNLLNLQAGHSDLTSMTNAASRWLFNATFLGLWLTYHHFRCECVNKKGSGAVAHDYSIWTGRAK